MNKSNILNYINKKSNQYNVSEKLYNMLIDKNIFESFGKKQYKSVKYKYNYNVKLHNELYNKLDIHLDKYNSFLDICSNPNNHSIYILNNNKNIKGIGISLYIDKGGYPPNPIINDYKDRYEIIYFDLLNDDKKKLLQNQKFDYASSDCFIGHNKDIIQTNKIFFNKILQLNSLDIILHLLKPGGDMIYLLPFQHDPIFFLNFLFLLHQIFKQNKLFKSETYTPDLSIVYIYSENYDINYNREFLNKIKNEEIIFDKIFLKQHIKDINYIYEKINIGLIKSIKQNK